MEGQIDSHARASEYRAFSYFALLTMSLFALSLSKGSPSMVRRAH